jgi:hypothetical protein
MIVRTMWGPRLRRAAVLLAVLAGSQLGHALVYLVRYGMASAQVQSAGVHAYFPVFTGALSAILGGALMASLLLLATARSLGPGPAGRRLRTTASFADLLPVLFTAQLVLFVGQETIESWVAGGHVPSVVEQLVWGSLGQLPAAALAAAILAWLLARLEVAWSVIAAAAANPLDQPLTPAVARAPRPEPAPVARLASAFPAAFRKRGPPSLLGTTAVS